MSSNSKRIAKARGNEGFTLIELMVVITILGILAGLAVPRFAVYRAEAKKIEAVAFGRQILNSFAVNAANDPANQYPIVETYEQLETVLRASGSPLTEAQIETFIPDDPTALPILVCKCERRIPDDFQGSNIYFGCSGRIPLDCDLRTVTFEYFLELPEFDQFLMISTDGTTQVITEDEIPSAE